VCQKNGWEGDMNHTITVVKMHAEMSVKTKKNVVSGGVKQNSILIY